MFIVLYCFVGLTGCGVQEENTILFNEQSSKTQVQNNIDEKEDNKEQRKDNIDMVDLIINNHDITSTTKCINITMKNNSNTVISTGNMFEIQKYDSTNWVDVPIKISSEDILYNIRVNEEKDFECILEEIPDWSIGRYRIMKSVIQDGKENDIFTEFDVN